MKQGLKAIVKKTPLYYPLLNWKVRRSQVRELVEWEEKGKPLPLPHLVKQQTLRTYAKGFGLRILVETGTYYGDMVEAMKRGFDRIYSIELSKELYDAAKERFKGARHIELICGDSGIELIGVMRKLDQPALFWLDGHYSGGVTARGEKDSPIHEELESILKSPDRRHVIIIDDARCFGRVQNYPSINELSELVESRRPDLGIAVEDDIIRIAPKAWRVNKSR